MGTLLRGLAAGAVGTEMLNVTTYLDMALRARGSSSVPEDDVDRMAERAGVRLGPDEESAANRRTAVATLLGYATGASIGVTCALGQPVLRRLPRLPAALLVGAAAMAATDAASAALGTTDPRTWSATDCLSDVVPHLAFGVGAVATLDALDR
jgi:hypothetical protein